MRKTAIIVFSLSLVTIIAIILSNICSLSEKDKEEIFDVLEIRKMALNKGDQKSFRYAVAAKHPDYDKIMKNFDMNAMYFTNINYAINNRKILEYSCFSQTAKVEQIFDLTFQLPEKEPKHLKNKKEIITLKKFETSWKIVDGLK